MYAIRSYYAAVNLLQGPFAQGGIFGGLSMTGLPKLTAGHAAFHEALFGDRLRLPLDVTLAAMAKLPSVFSKTGTITAA